MRHQRRAAAALSSLPDWHAGNAQTSNESLSLDAWTMSQQLLLSHVLLLLSYGASAWVIACSPMSLGDVQSQMYDSLHMLAARAMQGWTATGLDAPGSARSLLPGRRVEDLFERLTAEESQVWSQSLEDLVGTTSAPDPHPAYAHSANEFEVQPVCLAQSVEEILYQCPNVAASSYDFGSAGGSAGPGSGSTDNELSMMIKDLLLPSNQRRTLKQAVLMSGHSDRSQGYSQTSNMNTVVLPTSLQKLSSGDDGFEAAGGGESGSPLSSPNLAELLGHRNVGFFFPSSFETRPRSGGHGQLMTNPNPNPLAYSEEAEGGTSPFDDGPFNLLGMSCSVARTLMTSTSRFIAHHFVRNGTQPADAVRFSSLSESVSFTIQHAIGMSDPNPDPNPNPAMIAFRRAQAAAGDARAALEMGVGHYFGNDGLDVDRNLARQYFEMAANGPNPPAMALYNLATMTSHGEGGLQRDPERVREYFERAADMGHAPAAYGLAIQYLRNTDQEDDRKAARLLALAVAKGHSDAALNLGMLFLSGQGVEKSDILALKYIALAVARGQRYAKDYLGQELANPASWIRRLGFSHLGEPLREERAKDLVVNQRNSWRTVIEEEGASAEGASGGQPTSSAEPDAAAPESLEPYIVNSETTPGVKYAYNPVTGEIAVWAPVHGKPLGFGVGIHDDCPTGLGLLAASSGLAPWLRSALEQSTDYWTEATGESDLRRSLQHSELAGLYGSLQGLDNAAHLLASEFLPRTPRPWISSAKAQSPYAAFLQGTRLAVDFSFVKRFLWGGLGLGLPESEPEAVQPDLEVLEALERYLVQTVAAGTELFVEGGHFEYPVVEATRDAWGLLADYELANWNLPLAALPPGSWTKSEGELQELRWERALTLNEIAASFTSSKAAVNLAIMLLMQDERHDVVAAMLSPLLADSQSSVPASILLAYMRVVSGLAEAGEWLSARTGGGGQ